jgi:inosine-uridine nucleoside N-ribohydrolase
MEKKRVIIDADPGVDDIHAILFAFLCKQYDIEAITTVHGNLDVNTCTKNALYLVEQFADQSVPVYRGAARPLIGGMPHESTILHGNDGMGNTGLATPSLKRQPENAVSALIRLVMRSPGEITLLVLGPQTNIALAVQSEPDFAAAVKEIVFMGGRITPRADSNPFVTFNIGEDPEAAHIIIQDTDIPVTMLGQEVAMRIKFDPARLDRFASLGNSVGTFAAEISRFYVSQQMSIMGQSAGAIPDLSVVAYALRPELFNHRQLRIDVDCSSGPTRGATVSGSPPYFYVNGGLSNTLRNSPDIGEDWPDTIQHNKSIQNNGRTINVPSIVDDEAIVCWYEQLLSGA